jgi:hypothetical protein
LGTLSSSSSSSSRPEVGGFLRRQAGAGEGKNDEAPDGGNNSWIVLLARWQPRAALYFALLSVASSQCILMQNNSLRRNVEIIRDEPAAIFWQSCGLPHPSVPLFLLLLVHIVGQIRA